MHKILLPLIIILLPLSNYAQNNCTFRLLRSADEINKKPEGHERIKFVEYSPEEEIIADTYDNKKIVLGNSTVWGYQDNGCTIYRNSGSHFLKVEQAGELVVYSLQSRGFRNRLVTNYYFSKGLNGAIYLLDGENLAEQYKDNACFVKKLKQKFSSPFSQSYSSKQRQSFTVIELLRSCK